MVQFRRWFAEQRQNDESAGDVLSEPTTALTRCAMTQRKRPTKLLNLPSIRCS